jgi:hypothetical protein
VSAALAYRLSESVTAVQPSEFKPVINVRPPGARLQSATRSRSLASSRRPNELGPLACAFQGSRTSANIDASSGVIGKFWAGLRAYARKRRRKRVRRHGCVQSLI